MKRLCHIEFILFLLASVVFTSCVSTYEKNSEYAYQHTFFPTIDLLWPSQRMGYYGTTTYYNSGKMLRDTIYKNLLIFAPSARVLDDTKQFSEFDSSGANADYFIEPKILHWEDRNTEWSGKPDRVHVHITIIDILTGKPVSEFNFSGKSKWATFGGDHPQDLLLVPIQEYVETLFR